MIFNEKYFYCLTKDDEGIVLLDCDKNIEITVFDIMCELLDKEIASPYDFDDPFVIRRNDDILDLILLFKADNNIDFDKFELWRLLKGNCTYVQDYRHNHRVFHGYT